MMDKAEAEHRDPDEIVKAFGLAPHPEGGYFREVYRSKQKVSSLPENIIRSAVTHIYFLLKKGQVSRFHRVSHDEIWNYYQGDPVRLIIFDKTKVAEYCIGPGCDHYAIVVPGGAYQAAESCGDYSLAGCTVAPGFEFSDFSFLADMTDDVKVLMEKFSIYDKFV